MAERLIYRIVEHDGGWAYRVGNVYSETFRTREEAHSAADPAAREQRISGQTTDIEFETPDGTWHREHANGADRPETSVEG
ncbi:MAG: DUF2188 domain-containing protein [Mesorhizobium sp.]